MQKQILRDVGISVFDILILGLIGYAAWRGSTKGAVLESFSFATMIVGIYLASRFSDVTAAALSIRANGKDFSYIPVIMFSVLFGGLIYLSLMVRNSVSRQLESVENNQSSKILGAVFGGLHMFLLIGVTLVMLRAADFNFRVIPERETKYSFLYKPVVVVMTGLFPSLDYVGEVDEGKVKDELETKDQTKKVIDN